MGLEIINKKEPSLFYLGGAKVLVWRLEEEPAQLLALCREAGVPCEDLPHLPAKRQREKAAERLLLCRAFGHPVVLSHTEQGAPFVEGLDVNISITHTMRLVAVAIDDAQVVGLDAEQLDRRQVLKVRDKFLNAKEQQFIATDDLSSHIIAWTAKEAIIKAERNSALDWTEGICLDPFCPNGDETVFHAHCNGRQYRLVSCPVEGHCITLALLDTGQTRLAVQ